MKINTKSGLLLFLIGLYALMVQVIRNDYDMFLLAIILVCGGGFLYLQPE